MIDVSGCMVTNWFGIFIMMCNVFVVGSQKQYALWVAIKVAMYEGGWSNTSLLFEVMD